MTEIEHGNRNTYNNLGCRCAPCRAASSAWRKKYLDRKALNLAIADQLRTNPQPQVETDPSTTNTHRTEQP